MDLQKTSPHNLACLVLPQAFQEVQPNVADAFYLQKDRHDEWGAFLAIGTRLDPQV